MSNKVKDNVVQNKHDAQAACCVDTGCDDSLHHVTCVGEQFYLPARDGTVKGLSQNLLTEKRPDQILR